MRTELRPLYANLTSNLLGSETSSTLLLTGLLAEGHVLIQGSPGTGKTSLARAVARSIDAHFRRIQFTPDLLPTEIVGYTIYDQATSEFVFHRGPVFANVILADEINRASPRTQSALLEAMNESQVTVDGTTHLLEKPFFVIATENHLSSVGTFPLPDSQLDRFLVSFDMPLPEKDRRTDILEFHSEGNNLKEIEPCMTGHELHQLQQAAMSTHIERNVLEYIGDVCTAIGANPEFASGPSTRAAIGLMRAAKASAYLDEADAVYPDHVKQVTPNVFRHRLVLKSSASRGTEKIESILRDIVDNISVPMG